MTCNYIDIISPMEINRYIEHTLLKQDATYEQIKNLIDEAKKHGFFGVCVNPDYIRYAKELLKDTDIKLVTVVNFPLGKGGANITCAQVKEVIANGADEVDTVINVSDIKNKDYTKIKDEISKIKASCGNHNLKVILETDLLTDEEILKAAIICKDAGANFIKTSTGFVKNGIGATIEAVKIMKSTGMNVKASGGIKTRDQALSLIKAGATRLGTSSGCEIVKE